MVHSSEIRSKFGGDFTATDHTYMLGIDTRITTSIAMRFIGHHVLETCSGAGFTTIALARVADRVTAVDINRDHLEQARRNLDRAGITQKTKLVEGDSLSSEVLDGIGAFSAACLDPDWAVSGADHVYRFLGSNTQPPADLLLQAVLARTENVALVMAPYVDTAEFSDLQAHELQRIYLDGTHVLYCLYFGCLATGEAQSELRV